MASEVVVVAGQWLCLFGPVAAVHYGRRSSVTRKDSSPYGGWDVRETSGGWDLKSPTGYALSDGTFSHPACNAGGFIVSWQNLRLRIKPSTQRRALRRN